MKKDFVNANDQVRRLMEVIGGSSNAYDKEEEITSSVLSTSSAIHSNPFASKVDPLDKEESEQDIKVEELLTMCGTGMDEYPPPDPLSNDYVYHDIVNNCGELYPLWVAFTKVRETGQTKEANLDSGTYSIDHLNGSWILLDFVKHRKYLLESGNLSGHLAPDDQFVWVMLLDLDTHKDFGYIHNGFVFLAE